MSSCVGMLVSALHATFMPRAASSWASAGLGLTPLILPLGIPERRHRGVRLEPELRGLGERFSRLGDKRADDRARGFDVSDETCALTSDDEESFLYRRLRRPR
jgi:hypothetical protein